MCMPERAALEPPPPAKFSVLRLTMMPSSQMTRPSVVAAAIARARGSDECFEVYILFNAFGVIADDEALGRRLRKRAKTSGGLERLGGSLAIHKSADESDFEHQCGCAGNDQSERGW